LRAIGDSAVTRCFVVCVFVTVYQQGASRVEDGEAVKACLKTASPFSPNAIGGALKTIWCFMLGSNWIEFHLGRMIS